MKSSNFSKYFTFRSHHNQNDKFSLEILKINLYFIKSIVAKVDSCANIVSNILERFLIVKLSIKI